MSQRTQSLVNVVEESQKLLDQAWRREHEAAELADAGLHRQAREVLLEARRLTTYATEVVEHQFLNKCGYCGSTAGFAEPEELYGPGAFGWPACLNCHAV